METFSFEALGTIWNIYIQDEDTTNILKSDCITLVQKFEDTYSRFIPESLVGKLNANQSVVTSDEYKQMIAFGNKLERICDGYFNLHVGKQLSKLGYGTGAQNLDFGSFGKGWAIDLIAQKLQSNNIRDFCIEAGGDIYCTQKEDQTAWNIAVEHPTNPSKAIGMLSLQNQAFAASNPFKRSWGKQHHLINYKTGTAVVDLRAVYVVAQTTKIADGVATALSVTPKKLWKSIAQEFSIEYLVLTKDKQYKSAQFPNLIQHPN